MLLRQKRLASSTILTLKKSDHSRLASLSLGLSRLRDSAVLLCCPVVLLLCRLDVRLFCLCLRSSLLLAGVVRGGQTLLLFPDPS